MTKMLSIFIESVDGDTKQTTKLSLEDATELERILAVQNVFKVLGVDAAISDMLDDYIKIGKAYESVTTSKQTADPLEKPSPKPLPLKYDVGEYADEVQAKPVASDVSDRILDVRANNDTAMALAFAKTQIAMTTATDVKSSTENDDICETATSEADKTPSENEKSESLHFYETGVKHTPTGERYQCRLHCERCGLKRTHYIKPTDRLVYCHDCHKQHKVRPAKKSGHLVKDANKNFFIAGSIVGEDERINANT